MVPKKSGGRRLIMHLSTPDGNSINSFIDKQAYRFSLITIDTIAEHVRRTGPGAFLSKVDLKHAFRLCPVHPDDWPLLGMLWNGNYYIDTVLPFGLRSAPSLFNCLATTLEWILRKNYSIPALERYLDDFVSVCPAAESVTSSAATTHKATILQVFAKLGVPTADGPDKVVGPATCLTVLGIDIDSAAGELLAVLCSACISRLASRAHNIQPDVHLPPEDRLQTPPPQAMAPRANASPPAVYCSVCLSRVASPLALHPAEHISPAGGSPTDTTAASNGFASQRFAARCLLFCVSIQGR